MFLFKTCITKLLVQAGFVLGRELCGYGHTAPGATTSVVALPWLEAGRHAQLPARAHRAVWHIYIYGAHDCRGMDSVTYRRAFGGWDLGVDRWAPCPAVNSSILPFLRPGEVCVFPSAF